MYPTHMTSKATRWFEAQSGGSTDSMGVNISPAGTEEGHVEDEEDQECQAEAPSKTIEPISIFFTMMGYPYVRPQKASFSLEN